MALLDIFRPGHEVGGLRRWQRGDGDRWRGGRRDAHVKLGAGGAVVEGVERHARGVNNRAVIPDDDDDYDNFLRATSVAVHYGFLSADCPES